MEAEIRPLEVKEPRQDQLVSDPRGELGLVLDTLEEEILRKRKIRGLMKN